MNESPAFPSLEKSNGALTCTAQLIILARARASTQHNRTRDKPGHLPHTTPATRSESSFLALECLAGRVRSVAHILPFRVRQQVRLRTADAHIRNQSNPQIKINPHSRTIKHKISKKSISAKKKFFRKQKKTKRPFFQFFLVSQVRSSEVIL